jgi:hypothetical protein
MDADSDDDTYADGTEVFAGSDPTDPLSTPQVWVLRILFSAEGEA